ncbi:MAG: hypothetical protein LC795_05080 [Acidobacteria bacterium]|nr:hypothetical protein [Acidobacteriota bacterium]
MDEEQFERHKEYMLQQQAKLAEQQAQSAVRISQLEDLLVRFAQATRDRFEVADRRAHEIDEKIAALVNAQMRTEDKAPDIDRRLATLVEAQMKTDETVRKMGERIDNLTVVVERHIVEGHNGRAGS